MNVVGLKRFFSSATKKPRIGFIGLGNMGGPMVRNLLKKQYQVNAFDLDKNRVNEVSKDGAKACSDVQSVAKNSDAIITMLPNAKICKDVYLNQIFQNVAPGTVMLDCSTNGPITAKYLYEEAKKKNIDYMDAPVTGAVPAATAGTLCFLVGAPNETLFEKAKEALSPMAKAVINCKSPGAGQTAKICNNGALALQMVAVSNALVLGEKLGMDPKMLNEIMGISSARCWSLDTYNPVPGILEGAPSSRNYEKGFAASLMIKDIGLVLEAAEESGANVGLVKEMKSLYENLVKEGYGEKDFSYIYQYLRGKLNE